MKKTIVWILVLAAVAALFTGCKKNNEDAEKERVTMVVALDHQGDAPKMVAALEEVKSRDKYSHVDFDIRPTVSEFFTSMPIQIASGEQMDLVAVANPILQATWAKAGTIEALDPYIAELGIDYEAEFGQYVKNATVDGSIVTIPNTLTKWVLYYNKDIFDAAGEPYPGEDVPMTWDEYTALAARLTSGEGGDKIYGALQLTWPMYWYGEAIMKLGGGEYFYGADGLSNIEDPIFAKALERTYQMQHVDKSTPTHADIVASKTLAPAFMSGRYGMNVAGGWVLEWSNDDERYPRDWKIGIAPMPVDAGSTTKSWGIVDGIAIPPTSADPVLALELGIDLARTAGLNAQAAPSAAQVPQKMLYVTIGEAMARRDDGIDTALVQKIFANPETIFVTEKVTGPNNVEYETVIKEEVEKYFVQAQDLKTTIANIKERGDAAIQGN